MRYREDSLIFRGVRRTYLVQQPFWVHFGSPKPLVIVLHGSGGDSFTIETKLKLNRRSDREQFIIVYPDGAGDPWKREFTWNAGGCCGESRAQNSDDVGFIREMIGVLKKKYKIDDHRIYVAGYSNGGMMAYRLGCELSDQIAAIASVAGALDFDACRPAQPVSVIAIHGTDDPIVLYRGGVSTVESDKSYDRSVADAAKFWVEHNGCSRIPVKEQHGSVIRETYSEGKDGTEVVVYSIEGGGHAWPGTRKGVSFDELHETSQEISGTNEILKFFRQHPKASS